MVETRKPQDFEVAEIVLDRKRSMRFTMGSKRAWEREVALRQKADLIALQDLKEQPHDLSGLVPRGYGSFDIGNDDDVMTAAFVMMRAEDSALSTDDFYNLVPGSKMEQLRDAVADATQTTILRYTAEEMVEIGREKQEEKEKAKN